MRASCIAIGASWGLQDRNLSRESLHSSTNVWEDNEDGTTRAAAASQLQSPGALGDRRRQALVVPVRSHLLNGPPAALGSQLSAGLAERLQDQPGEDGPDQTPVWCANALISQPEQRTDPF